MEPASHWRYRGAAPFRDRDIDHKIFFGRAEESRELLYLVLAERLVVLFAKSGVGKTSLINASLMERLRERDYFPVGVRFSDDEQDPLRSIFDAMATEAQKHNVDRVGGDQTDLRHFFEDLELWSEDDDLLHPVLIFDQFEELFTPQAQEIRNGFVAQLAKLLRSKSRAKVVISIREDYLAYLDDMALSIPTILHNRFRLGPLRRDGAHAAIIEPAQVSGTTFRTAPYSYEEDAVRRIVKFLSVGCMRTRDIESDRVEPFQLQLLCSHYEEIAAVRQADADGEVVLSDEDVGDERYMERVLENFYEQTLARFPWRSRAAIQGLCEKGLTTGGGLRRTEEQQEIANKFGVTGESLRKLVDLRLLRGEPRLGSIFYELSHDTLVEPIQRSRSRRTTGRVEWTGVVALTFLALVAVLCGVRGLLFDPEDVSVLPLLRKTQLLTAEEYVHQVVEAGGRIWLATDSGAYRLDGVGLTYVLGGILVQTIAEVGDEIWAGSNEGLYEVSRDHARPILEDSVGRPSISVIRPQGMVVWLGADRGLFRVEGDRVVQPILRERVYDVQIIDGAVWVGTNRNAYRVGKSGIPEIQLEGRWVSRIAGAGGSIWLITNRDYGLYGPVYQVIDGNPREVAGDYEVVDVTEIAGEAWLATTDGVVRFVGGEPLLYPTSEPVNLLAEVRERVWLGTTRGIYFRDGRKFRPLAMEERLNVKGIIAAQGGIWAWGAQGAYRLEEAQCPISPAASLALTGTSLILAAFLVARRLRARRAHPSRRI